MISVRIDWVLVGLTFLLGATLTAFALESVPYPYGFIALLLLILARLVR